MAAFADSKVQDGTMSRNRLIFPGWRRIRKLIENAFMRADSDQSFPDGEATGIIVWLGDSLSPKKDPEHLPPSNWYERATDHFRLIPQYLGSDASAFGFRAVVAISMGAHAGAGVQGFLARVFGTAVATVASITIWYMADQKPAAVIPLAGILFVCALYVVLKNPKHLITAVISIVTTILILGYELQDNKVGTRTLETNGQQYYSIYLLAPYRLVSVLAGIAVAFIWTYFPYPVTTHATLRKDLGATLYLMANYYSITHSTVETKLRHGLSAKLHDKSCPVRKLDKARLKVFDKITVMMNRLREHSDFTKYEPTFGGKFPKQTYDELVSSQPFTASPDSEESPWIRDFRQVTAQSRVTDDELTSTLCLVSASITNSQPLPPYVRVPLPIDIAAQLAAVDPGILSIKHVQEPCYAAFAVLEIASILVMLEMTQVLAKVKELVGEVDFSIPQQARLTS
ncbi:uncharacterized protein Z518_03134 [Rhinocladiella mackenziei CBS 650.93]|uniref:Integral membrane bound transporter domain-containing protein n=1 Tax=Rhinocladiella mackenziei CBS 650.93 TaxID=1442369 RepID=A0A0D2HDB8_9EURO|nr:uncharacterized protein Z518_03134 [Rhinocladiella mackenziei CBS 650.93]KIX08478.1 hypothetical protein Z518_03134 [Rhinocladiella mackenziei CBS 650.93]